MTVTSPVGTPTGAAVTVKVAVSPSATVALAAEMPTDTASASAIPIPAVALSEEMETSEGRSSPGLGERVAEKVSSPSTRSSSRVGTLTVTDVSPAGMVTVPAGAV